MLNNAVELSHFYLKNCIKPGSFVVDATCGNGGDTVYLASLVGKNGEVMAFDIQPEAIANTKKHLEQANLAENVSLILDGHQNMEQYLCGRKADAFVFNLGYLPGGDHSLHTKPETTLSALKIAVSSITAEGIVCVSIYHGKDSGFAERDAVLDYLQTLDSHQYNVIIHQYSNKPNFPPIFALICKNGHFTKNYK